MKYFVFQLYLLLNILISFRFILDDVHGKYLIRRAILQSRADNELFWPDLYWSLMVAVDRSSVVRNIIADELENEYHLLIIGSKRMTPTWEWFMLEIPSIDVRFECFTLLTYPTKMNLWAELINDTKSTEDHSEYKYFKLTIGSRFRCPVWRSVFLFNGTRYTREGIVCDNDRVDI